MGFPGSFRELFQKTPLTPGGEKPVFCVSGALLWSLCSNKSFHPSVSLVLSHPCLGGRCRNSFSLIRMEKLCLAKSRSPRERWAQLLPKRQDLLVSPSLTTPADLPISEDSKFWSSLLPCATSLEKATGIWAVEQSLNPCVPPPASSQPHLLHFQELM